MLFRTSRDALATSYAMQAEPPSGLIAQARQVALLRLLLLAMALGIVVFAFDGRKTALVDGVLLRLAWLFAGILSITALLAVAVPWVRHRWQLLLHLVFDLGWIGLLAWHTGGVASPAVALLFAVVLIGNIVLPGMGRFLMPALAALVMVGNASLYLAKLTPFPDAWLALNPAVADTHRIVGTAAVQVAAFFLVDLLAQLLARRLHEERLFTDQLLDQLGEGVLAVDRHGQVAYVNDEAVRLLGLSGVVQGRPLAQVLTGALVPVRELIETDRSPLQERFDASNVHGGVRGPIGSSGERRHLVLRVTDLIGRGGRHLGRTLLIADETRLRLLEDNARRAEHLASLGEMAAGIAHEVRNPLTSLRGCAQELAEICARSSSPDAAALAGIMISEADRLGRIVTDFLTLSRLREPQRQPLALAPVIDELASLCRARRDLPQGLKLVLNLAPDCPPIAADPDQLRQVLSNLINNSLDAVLHVPFPSLTIAARRADPDNPLGGEAVVITVADNGEGISLELQERIFTPFFSTKSQGTGLGLSLVSRIVREHEGELHLDSRPGMGTTVTVHLPLHSQTRVYRRALGAT